MASFLSWCHLLGWTPLACRLETCWSVVDIYVHVHINKEYNIRAKMWQIPTRMSSIDAKLRVLFFGLTAFKYFTHRVETYCLFFSMLLACVCFYYFICYFICYFIHLLVVFVVFCSVSFVVCFFLLYSVCSPCSFIHICQELQGRAIRATTLWPEHSALRILRPGAGGVQTGAGMPDLLLFRGAVHHAKRTNYLPLVIKVLRPNYLPAAIHVFSSVSRMIQLRYCTTGRYTWDISEKRYSWDVSKRYSCDIFKRGLRCFKKVQTWSCRYASPDSDLLFKNVSLVSFYGAVVILSGTTIRPLTCKV